MNPLLKVDLDIDSDNTNGAGAPDRSAAEETLEDDDEKPGKLIAVNNGDFDTDGIPDYADGFDGETLPGVNFTKLVLEMPDGIDIDKLKVKLVYSASDPSSINVAPQNSGSSGVGRDSSWTTRGGQIYELPSGNLRIWKKDASESRTSTSVVSNGDFVPSDTEIDFEDLNDGGTERTITLYVEGLKPSGFPGDDTIELKIGIDNGGSANYFDADEVRVTVTDVAFKDASGEAFLARDDYSFGSADFSHSASYDDPASLVVYSMKANESMTLNTLTLPAAPQVMNEVIDYYVGERSQGSAPLAATNVTPDGSSAVNQVISVTSTGGEGFTYLEANAGERSGSDIAASAAGVMVFEEQTLNVGVVRVNQRYNDSDPNTNDFDAPSFTELERAQLETYLNEVYGQAHTKFVVTKLNDLNVDYDVTGEIVNGVLTGNPNGKLTLNGSDTETGRISVNTSNLVVALVLVNGIEGHNPFQSPVTPVTYDGVVQDPGTKKAYVTIGGSSTYFKHVCAHEIGHVLGLPHPFDHGDYDPENLMNYCVDHGVSPSTDKAKLRSTQWNTINALGPSN